MKTLFKNARCYLEGIFTQTDILVADGCIVGFSKPCCSFEDIREIDLSGCYLVPGFIDIHTHGADGVDVNAACEKDFARLSRFFASKGTTAYLASVLTDSRENTLRILETVVRYRLAPHPGAVLLGAHLEGPFLSKEKKGAMPEQYLNRADTRLLNAYLDTGAVKYITVAPEIPAAAQLIAAAAEKIPVAIGHSAADYDCAMRAVAAGARAATHTFNAMAGIDRVEPHILGAVLDSDIYAEIIADGKHVHPANVRLLYRMKGERKIIAVTDSIQAAGLGDGAFKLGVNDVVVQGGDAFLKGTRSRAGSVLTMDNALHNLMHFLDLPLEEVLPMLTENPADLLGLNKGYLRVGYDADFALLDADFAIRGVVIGGVYTSF